MSQMSFVLLRLTPRARVLRLPLPLPLYLSISTFPPKILQPQLLSLSLFLRNDQHLHWLSQDYPCPVNFLLEIPLCHEYLQDLSLFILDNCTFVSRNGDDFFHVVCKTSILYASFSGFILSE